MTLDEMAEFSKVGRRTIERRRDAIETVFGPLDQIEDGRLVRFRMNGRGLGSFATLQRRHHRFEVEVASGGSERIEPLLEIVRDVTHRTPSRC